MIRPSTSNNVLNIMAIILIFAVPFFTKHNGYHSPGSLDSLLAFLYRQPSGIVTTILLLLVIPLVLYICLRPLGVCMILNRDSFSFESNFSGKKSYFLNEIDQIQILGVTSSGPIRMLVSFKNSDRTCSIPISMLGRDEVKILGRYFSHKIGDSDDRSFFGLH